MKILSYQYSTPPSGTENYEKAYFGNVNLIVGLSAAGKSRLLNTIYWLGVAAVRKEKPFGGKWEIEFDHNGIIYYWLLVVDSKTQEVIEETIKEIKKSKNSRKEKILVRRTATTFKLGNKQVPLLDFGQTSVFLLRANKQIKPIYEAFILIIKRNFDQDELTKANRDVLLNDTEIKRIDNLPNKNLMIIDMPLSARLYFLKKDHPKQFQSLIDFYMEVFPFVTHADIIMRKIASQDSESEGFSPSFVIKQKGIDKHIEYNNLSSGMQKVLIILADIISIPPNSVILLDEYENSLGINAINFFPEYLIELEKPIQFFITSHHPYIINKIPRENWYLLSREAGKIKILFGEKLLERFSGSKQESFTLLMNDPLYSGK